MNKTFRVNDLVCEIANPKIKMRVDKIDEENQVATCSWISNRKTQERSSKEFPFDKLTLASDYFPKYL